MRYDHIHNRVKGSIETFGEDASRASDVAASAVTTMVASVTSGSSASIVAQTYTAATESLAFQLNFSQVGSTVIKVTTTFDTGDSTVTAYLFRTTDDGTGIVLPDYT
jgi:hypothetical protein